MFVGKEVRVLLKDQAKKNFLDMTNYLITEKNETS